MYFGLSMHSTNKIAQFPIFFRVVLCCLPIFSFLHVLVTLDSFCSTATTDPIANARVSNNFWSAFKINLRFCSPFYSCIIIILFWSFSYVVIEFMEILLNMLVIQRNDSIEFDWSEMNGNSPCCDAKQSFPFTPALVKHCCIPKICMHCMQIWALRLCFESILNSV